jgi:hypothetical protein
VLKSRLWPLVLVAVTALISCGESGQVSSGNILSYSLQVVDSKYCLVFKEIKCIVVLEDPVPKNEADMTSTVYHWDQQGKYNGRLLADNGTFVVEVEGNGPNVSFIAPDARIDIADKGAAFKLNGTEFKLNDVSNVFTVTKGAVTDATKERGERYKTLFAP